jgi:hypothetical protein
MKDKIKRESKDSLKTNIEIWSDLVNIKDLVIALLICSFTTFGGYFLSPNASYKPLLFGLLGAIIGFIISGLIIEPKRVVMEEDKEL